MDGIEARKTKIEVRNLTKRFGDLLALDEISFNVGKANFSASSGPRAAARPPSSTPSPRTSSSKIRPTKMAYSRDISTYGGCAGACAAALESSRIIEEENLRENSRVVGDYLLGCLEELRAFPIVGDVRGRGLFAGIEFVEDRKMKQPVSELFLMSIIKGVNDQGVLVGRTNRRLTGLNNIINLAPAPKDSVGLCLLFTGASVIRKRGDSDDERSLKIF